MSILSSRMTGRGSLFYGWIVVALAFVTMGIGVTVTRAFTPVEHAAGRAANAKLAGT